MKLHVTAHHATLSDKIKEYVEKRLAKLERHFSHITDTHVVIKSQKKGFVAEATVHVSGSNLFAEAHASDPFSAIDALGDKLDRQIVKYKEKISDHRVQKAS